MTFIDLTSILIIWDLGSLSLINDPSSCEPSAVILAHKLVKALLDLRVRLDSEGTTFHDMPGRASVIWGRVYKENLVVKAYRHINAGHCKPSLHRFSQSHTHHLRKCVGPMNAHDVPHAAGTLLSQAPSYLTSNLCGPMRSLNCHI